MTKLLLPFLDGNFLPLHTNPLTTQRLKQLTSQRLQFQVVTFCTQQSHPHLLPTPPYSSTYSGHRLLFGPLQEVATRRDLPINSEEQQQKEDIKENNERSIGKQKIDE
jgi:hypothetical protein